MKYLHTMVRISDVDKSLDFYCNKLGLKEVRRMENPQGRFTLYYLAAPGDEHAQVTKGKTEAEAGALGLHAKLRQVVGCGGRTWYPPLCGGGGAEARACPLRCSRLTTWPLLIATRSLRRPDDLSSSNVFRPPLDLNFGFLKVSPSSI